MKLIKNAKISTGIQNETKLVNILYNNKIIEISENHITNNTFEIIDLKGKLLIPGCIDSHVHFNDPGFTEHEDFLSGTTAAAFGGITTVIDMPCTSIPPVTTYENLHKKLTVIEKKTVIDFALWGGIRGNDLPIDKNEVFKLWNAGIVGFKIYTISGMSSFKALSYDEIREMFQEFPEFLFAFHAEDKIIIEKETAKIEDHTKIGNYVKTRPVFAEFEAVKNIIEAAKTENKIHFVHISSKKTADLIMKSKNDISFETCPHYLQFTSDDFPLLKGKLKTAPPVKFEEDRTFLRDLVKNGLIDFITTDHAGCDWETEKNISDFSKVYNGIPGCELMIPYLFSEFYLKEIVDLKTMIKLTSENAAKRYGLFPQKGSLQIGTDADFTVIDLTKSFVVDEKEIHSKGKYSPFHDQEFSCSIYSTIVRGETVYNNVDGISVKPGFGKFLRKG